MITKVSKAQLEVWEWKGKSYNQIKNMPLQNTGDEGGQFIFIKK